MKANLEWGATAPRRMKWHKALLWCSAQGNGKCARWRIPTIGELSMAYERKEPGFAPDEYWSASEDGEPRVDGNRLAMSVDFRAGRLWRNYKSSGCSVRCVREVLSSPREWGGFLENKIVCGFAGIGKSELAKSRAGVVDLESTPFEKDWKRYVKVAQHMQKGGYTVLVACHQGLREEFQRQQIPYILALPPQGAKEEYLDRYRGRGNDVGFVKLLEENWLSFLSVMPTEEVVEVDRYLADVYSTEKN
jgi:hypothetical protein